MNDAICLKIFSKFSLTFFVLCLSIQTNFTCDSYTIRMFSLFIFFLQWNIFRSLSSRNKIGLHFSRISNVTVMAEVTSDVSPQPHEVVCNLLLFTVAYATPTTKTFQLSQNLSNGIQLFRVNNLISVLFSSRHSLFSRIAYAGISATIQFASVV